MTYLYIFRVLEYVRLDHKSTMAFEDAYDQYCAWTETEHVEVVLSSSKLSTLIGRLFPEAKYKYIFKNGQKIGNFDNLHLRSVGERYSSKDEEFKVPG